MTRFRPHFSIRTLAIFVTLACCYFGAWEATKRYGVEHPIVKTIEIDGETIPVLIDALYAQHSPAPFITYCEYRGYGCWSGTCYFWLFGIKVALYQAGNSA